MLRRGQRVLFIRQQRMLEVVGEEEEEAAVVPVGALSSRGFRLREKKTGEAGSENVERTGQLGAKQIRESSCRCDRKMLVRAARSCGRGEWR